MKISFEFLDKLNTWEYQEYKNLKRKDFDGDSIGTLLLVVFHISFSLALALSLFWNETAKDWKEILGLLALFIIYPAFWIPTIIIGTFLEESYKKVFNYFSHKTNSYERFKHLERKFQEDEKKVRDQLMAYVDYQLSFLISKLKRNVSNPEIYDDLLKIFLSNHNFVKEAINQLGLTGYEKKYERTLKMKDVWFEKDLIKIKEERKTSTKQPLFYTLGKKVGKTFSSKKSSPKTSLTTLGNIKIQREKINSKPQTEYPKVETKKLQEFTKPQLNASEPSDNFLHNIYEIPTKKNRIIRPRTIKASDKFWEDLGKKRIEIGKKGELLVMEYERKRISSEEGKEFVKKLRHSSLMDADGLGYDITSFEDGREIYIEVKTTTGNFESGLFFTQNELNIMNKLGERYYLYRIYNFDKLTNTGKLKIFKGAKEINFYFDFTPQTYALRLKN